MTKICKEGKVENIDNSKYCCQCGAELNVSTADENKRNGKITFKECIGCVLVLLFFGGISYVGNEVLHLHSPWRLLFGFGCFFCSRIYLWYMLCSLHVDIP